MSLGTLKQTMRAPPDKCTVYWDYENMPIPKKCNLAKILSTLKDKLWTLIGNKLPIEFKVYIRASKLTPQIQNDFDINGIVQIQIPSKKPESVDKRLMIDMTFSLYELERDNKSRAIALISGDRDFGHLLSKIHHQPPVANSFLILLKRTYIDKNLSNVVDHVIQLNCGGKNAGDHTYAQTQIYEEKISKRDRDHRDRDRYKISNDNKSNSSKTKQITVHITNLMDLTQTFEFNTNLTNRAHNIKCAIFNKTNDENANIQQLTLLFKGKEIKNQNLLTKCGIANGDTLMWYFDKNKKVPEKMQKNISLKKNIRLKLQNLNSNQTFEINTTKTNSIRKLRQEIYVRNKKLNVPKEQFVLYYQETELMDSKQISSYNIIEGDTLIWYTDENRSDKNKKPKKKKKKAKILLTLQHETSEFNNIEIESKLVNLIANIMFTLKRKLNIKQENIVIIRFGGKALDKKATLKTCGITQNAILSWKIFADPLPVLQANDKEMSEEVVSPQLINESEEKQIEKKECEAKITVIVKNEMNKATLLFPMSKTDSVSDLKGMIEKRLLIYRSDQILMCDGKLLEDKNGFVDGDTIDFKVILKAVTFAVQVLDGDCIEDMRFWNNMSVLDLKKEISKICGLDATDQMLKCDGTEMIDSYYLYNYGISDGHSLKLTLK